MTSALEAHPPRGLGFSYIMYGWNNLGVCTMNLYASRSPPGNPAQVCEDIVIHFDPRPKWSHNALFVTDDRRCGTWQHAYAPWSDQSWWWRTDKLRFRRRERHYRVALRFQVHRGWREIRSARTKSISISSRGLAIAAWIRSTVSHWASTATFTERVFQEHVISAAVWPRAKNPFYVP